VAVNPRRLILANLKETLVGIREADGYKTTVHDVEIAAKAFAEIKTSQRPWIGIVPGREDWTYQPAGGIRSTWNVALIIHQARFTKDQDLQFDRLNEMLDDVVAILNVDTTRGGCAVMTTIAGLESDEGANEGGAGMVIRLEIVYFRTTGAS